MLDSKNYANIYGRETVFCSLVGSHNYNLNDENSDRDYKFFILPSFEDLYGSAVLSKSSSDKGIDYSIHDIRTIPDLFRKANINFLEVLFSQEAHGFKPDYVAFLYNNRERIARMNLPYLYDACLGMYSRISKQLNKGTVNTQHLVVKYGYDTKALMNMFRVLDFLHRYYNGGFSSFQRAIWYEEEDAKFLKNIKNGLYHKELILLDCNKLLDALKNDKNMVNAYKLRSLDTEMYALLVYQTKLLIRNSLKEGSLNGKVSVS